MHHVCNLVLRSSDLTHWATWAPSYPWIIVPLSFFFRKDPGDAAQLQTARQMWWIWAGICAYATRRHHRSLQGGRVASPERDSGNIKGNCSAPYALVTIRMDVHLKSVHKMLKGTGVFERTLQESRMFVGSASTQDLHRALVDYGWVSLYFFISIACVSHISSMKVFSSCSPSMDFDQTWYILSP